MRKYLLHTLIISIFPLVLFTCSLVSAQSHQLADEYWNKAEALEKQGKYLEAAKMFEKSVNAEKASSSPKMLDFATALGRAGYNYHTVAQYDKAVKNYEEALAIFRNQGQEGGVATLLNNIGTVYKSWGQYEKAIKYYEEALVIDKRLGREDIVAIDIFNIGMVYNSCGQYDKAIKKFEEALVIDKRLGREGGVATRLNNIGTVYKSWGQYDKAIKKF
ncbi:MAG: tetratricopeptide repeat protein, partial [Candidatus Brocadiaceae bacterium]|nr:tetratricopeptide repeat protein [Candidatus Brocadiaceae bacterium]